VDSSSSRCLVVGVFSAWVAGSGVPRRRNRAPRSDGGDVLLGHALPMWEDVAMVGRLVPAEVGGVHILIETLPAAAGTELTAGRVEDASQRVVEAFDQIQGAIAGIASRVVASLSAMVADVVEPDSVQVEFGLSFTASGNLVIVGGSGQASLKVTLKYDAHRGASTSALPSGRGN
jgi:hypothetical protein